MRIIALLYLTISCGCTIVYPPGWAARHEPPIVIEPTRGVVSVGPQRSWNLPDGRVIQLDVDTNAVGMFGTLVRADIEFSAALRESRLARIQCQSDPAIDGFPEARFGCWGERIEFWLTPGERCSLGLQTQMESDCWNGELTVEGRPISLVRGRMERSGLPVRQISWVSQEGPLLVADNRIEHQIRVYDVGSELSEDVRDLLLVLTVAMFYYEHATDPD